MKKSTCLLFVIFCIIVMINIVIMFNLGESHTLIREHGRILHYYDKDHYMYYIDDSIHEYNISDVDIEYGFDVWSDINDITFTRVYDNNIPDIIVSFGYTHPIAAGTAKCSFGICNIAIYQGAFDCNNEYQYMTNNRIRNAIIHEIGHVIGLQHSNVVGDTMYGLDGIDDYNPRNLNIPTRNNTHITFVNEGPLLMEIGKMVLDGDDIPEEMIEQVRCYREINNNMHK